MFRTSSLAVALLATFAVSCGNESPSEVDSGPPPWWNDPRDDRDVAADVPVVDTSAPDAEQDVEQDVEVDTYVSPELDDGDPCGEDRECAGRTCLPDPSWPEGYCTARPCRLDQDCSGTGTICSAHEGESMCALRCALRVDCRDGYDCVPAEGRPERICVPRVEEVVTGSPDGFACTSDDDCAGGTCFADPDWPNGYCTSVRCATFHDCARGEGGDEFDNRCLVQQGTNHCVRLCDNDADCRFDEGYLCQSIGGGQGMCVPGRAAPPSDDVDFDEYPFDVTCGLANEGGEVTIEYTVAEDTSAYMLVPIAVDGSRLEPVEITLPDGETIDLQGENLFQLAPSILFGFLNPVVVPSTEEYAEQLQAGEHEMVIRTYSTDVCWYLLEESADGETIDVNVYLVGVAGVDAETAAEDPNLAQVFETFDEIFAPAGVSIGELRFVEPPEGVVETLQIIRNQYDVERLVEQSDLPGQTTDEVLSLNVFFVRAFAFSDGSGVIGMSMGLPGAAGAHGTRSSGVAFTSEFLGGDIPGEGDGNVYTGLVLAHEVGHYLGLFHTSEQFGAGFDPLPDTPECTGSFPDGCPDIENLMFPWAGITHTEVTEDQAWQIRVNPLTKP